MQLIRHSGASGCRRKDDSEGLYNEANAATFEDWLRKMVGIRGAAGNPATAQAAAVAAAAARAQSEHPANHQLPHRDSIR